MACEGVLLAEAFAALAALERRIARVRLDVTEDFLLLRELGTDKWRGQPYPSTFVLGFAGANVCELDVIR